MTEEETEEEDFKEDYNDDEVAARELVWAVCGHYIRGLSCGCQIWVREEVNFGAWNAWSTWYRSGGMARSCAGHVNDPPILGWVTSDGKSVPGVRR